MHGFDVRGNCGEIVCCCNFITSGFNSFSISLFLFVKMEDLNFPEIKRKKAQEKTEDKKEFKGLFESDSDDSDSDDLMRKLKGNSLICMFFFNSYSTAKLYFKCIDGQIYLSVFLSLGLLSVYDQAREQSGCFFCFVLLVVFFFTLYKK